MEQRKRGLALNTTKAANHHIFKRIYVWFFFVVLIKATHMPSLQKIKWEFRTVSGFLMKQER